MADKEYLQAFTSPTGEAVFPWITRSDTEHDASGVFHTDLSLPLELAEEFIAKLEIARDGFTTTLTAAQQKALTPKDVYRMELTRPAKDATDEEREAFEPEETGNVLFRFKLKQNVVPANGDPFTQSPIVVDAATGEKIEVPVYGGSIIRVRGQIVPYTNAAAGAVGVTLRMKAVQVIELVTGEGASGFWTDFDEENEKTAA